MRFKIFLKSLGIVLLSAVFFAGIIFVFSRENLTGVDVPKTDEPYLDGKFLPENSTVMFSFPDNYGTVIELDFKEKRINAIIIEDPGLKRAQQFGFNITHTCVCDYTFLMDFIDIIGGIELTNENEHYRYTGVQIANLIASFKEDVSLRARILESVFTKIKKNGFSNEALSCIIENTQTTLSAPACYGWIENMSSLCASFNIINER